MITTAVLQSNELDKLITFFKEKNDKMNNNFKLLASVPKTYWYINKILINIPRKEIVLKTRVEENMLAIIELTYSYMINSDNLKIRKTNIKNILIKLSMCDFFLLEIYNRGYIKNKKYESITNYILEIRKISYGLLKNEKDCV